jgi:hypothetical protein
MSDSDTPEFYSTVPISSPTVVPEAEDIPMNGFVWSTTFGLLLAMGQEGDMAVDELFRLRENLDDINLSDQGIRGLD